jgi:hypothetical protein
MWYQDVWRTCVVEIRLVVSTVELGLGSGFQRLGNPVRSFNPRLEDLLVQEVNCTARLVYM